MADDNARADALAGKHCVPCEGDALPLAEPQIVALRGEIDPAWEVMKNKKLSRSFPRFKNFVAAMTFANDVARLAEEEGHHPDIYIHYNNVRLELSTHAIGGLSENDFILAAKIDRLQASVNTVA